MKIDQCCATMATHKSQAVAKSLLAVTSSAAADIVDATSAHVIHTTTSNHVKLLQLTLHPFNGDKTTWPTFWDSYESAVHNNDELSDIDKFNYLRALLEKSAYDSIAGLLLTAANYAKAIAILKKRFGNKQQIISKHILSAEAVTSASNLKGVRKLYDCNTQEFMMPEECAMEMKAKDKCTVHSLLTMDVPTGLGQIMKCDDFSTLSRLC